MLSGLVYLAVGACAGGSDGAAPAPTSPAATQAGVHVADPLDVRGATACTTVPPDVLEAAGMDPATATDASNDLATICDWHSADGVEGLRFTLSVDTAIELMYASVGHLPDYTPFTLRGHPAVRDGRAESTICRV